MSIDRFAFLRAYFGTRRAQAHLTTRERIADRQGRLWRSFGNVVRRTPALSKLAGKGLLEFPIVSPGEIRAQFGQWNTLNLTADNAARAAAEAERGGAGELAPGLIAGLSTGTSGARGLFISSRTERAQYLGQAIAKLLPWDALLRNRRIALCLRADNALYRDVTNAGPFAFRFFDLGTPAPLLLEGLGTFAPHILVAPSHVLAELAGGSAKFSSLERLFYGAEPMNDDERQWVRDRMGVRPDPIYQATEGFLGASCSHGALHINEDTLIMERQAVPGTNRFQPIVTDLRRSTQPVVRLLLDDLLEPLATLCPCGSALLGVRGIEGRIDDLWRWNDTVIPPREIETAITRAVGAGIEWRSIASPTGVTIEIGPDQAAPAAGAITSLLARHRLTLKVRTTATTPLKGPKRRRVVWQNA